MKIKFAILLAMSALAFNASATPHESGSRRAALAIEIRYMNTGSGIDVDLQEQINVTLDSKKITRKISYIKESDWGHEGESTVCIEFNDFNDTYLTFKEIDALIQQAKTTATQAIKKTSCDPHVVPQPNE